MVENKKVCTKGGVGGIITQKYTDPWWIRYRLEKMLHMVTIFEKKTGNYANLMIERLEKDQGWLTKPASQAIYPSCCSVDIVLFTETSPVLSVAFTMVHKLKRIPGYVSSSVSDPDPHSIGRLDPDPHSECGSRRSKKS
jgi:hypothetical protein